MRTFDTSTLRAACLVMVASLAILEAAPARAGNPRGAAYCPAADRVFWFIQVSDLHIGTSGSNDTNRLTWIVTTGKTIIAPRFVVATGDLTDSTNANWLGIPNGPYQAEWDAYRAILDGRVDATNYFDIPGNHDAYNDRYFAYYLANSVQGRATGRTQASWTFVRAPILIRFTSPRTTLVMKTLASSPSATSPITWADGSTQARGPSVGRIPL